jgi:hypothetical protein
MESFCPIGIDERGKNSKEYFKGMNDENMIAATQFCQIMLRPWMAGVLWCEATKAKEVGADMPRRGNRPRSGPESALLWLVLCALCLGLAQIGAAEEIENMGAAPWSASKLKRSAVPSVYISEWKKAENRDRCALLVIDGLSGGSEFKSRRANFAGGWAVAYDSAKVRSAFGIAGSGSDVDSADPVYKFPFTRRWADGSVANYGLEAGVGPNYLAYLEVAGQKCSYNIWSRLGRAHLESLIDRLRFVDAEYPQGLK